MKYEKTKPLAPEADEDPVAVREEYERLQAERAALEKQIDADPARDAIKAAMEAGRERLDPRTEAEKQRQGDRIPLGGQRMKLTVTAYEDQLKGLVPRWINDQHGRIQDALRAGYRPIFRDGVKAGDGEDMNTDLGSWVSEVVGRNEAGGPIRAYLMGLRQDLYEQDQAVKRAKVQELNEAIKSGAIGTSGQDVSNRYVKTYSQQVR